MWHGLGESIQGTSHVASRTPCQDANFYCAYQTDEGPCYLIAVADGAGSAAKADVASKLATQAAFEELTKYKRHPSRITQEEVIELHHRIRDRLLLAAQKDGVEARDYSCTLLLSILSETSCVFSQVGDGCIVTGTESGYKAVTWPHNGEYVNQTTFVVSSNFPSALQFVKQERDFDFVAVFTDGIQDLVLTHSTKSVHDRFFPSFRNGLKKSDDYSSLRVPLAEFLNSPKVNERTDDDKTLVMALWQDAPRHT